MQSVIGAVNVPILIQNLPDLACTEINSFLDALKALTVYGSVDIPASITNVIVGVSEPTSNDANKIWFRYDNSGNFLGIYAFQAGQWRQVIQNIPGQVYWLAVDSATGVPDGFTIIDASGPSFISAGTRTHIQTFYYPAGPGPYTYSAFYFSGY